MSSNNLRILQKLAHVAALVLALVVIPAGAGALPRMTLTSGSKCENCHINPQGSGIRSAMGFYSADELHMVGWDKLGLRPLQSLGTNQVAGDKVTIGADLRFQMAKLGRPVYDAAGKVQEPDRMFIPMQAAVGLAWDITPRLQAAASINGAAFKYRFPGQTHADGWLRYVPENTAIPSVRAGLIQPSVGIRHDDHTILIRSNPFNPRGPMLPASYNDPGVELSWAPVHGVTVEAAGLYAHWLAEANQTVKKASPIGSARVTWSPQFLDLGLNSWVGASTLYNDGLFLQGGHVGIGKGYLGSLQAEVLHGKDRNDNETLSWLVHAAWSLREWLVIEGRVEQSVGTAKVGKDAETRAAVAGIQWFPMRFVEIRPEYRYFETKDYTVGQWSAQLHLWF